MLVDPWINHLFWLDALVQCGCRFGLDDLEIAEWRGLGILVDERNRKMREETKQLETP